MNIWETRAPAKSAKKQDLKNPKRKDPSTETEASDTFPHLESNPLNDGYLGVAPIKSYTANQYGLHNMLGNVWEWVKGGTEKEVCCTVCFIWLFFYIDHTIIFYSESSVVVHLWILWMEHLTIL